MKSLEKFPFILRIPLRDILCLWEVYYDFLRNMEDFLCSMDILKIYSMVMQDPLNIFYGNEGSTKYILDFFILI